MAITADHVATLKAYLWGSKEEYEGLRDQLSRESIANDYTLLVTGAFITATLEHLGDDPAPEEIKKFVADTRMRSAQVATKMDPRNAERIVNTVMHNEDISDLDDSTVFGYQLVLLAGLAAELFRNERDVDEFIEKTRAFLAQAP